MIKFMRFYDFGHECLALLHFLSHPESEEQVDIEFHSIKQ